jgi:hypothetical protein
MGKKQGTEKSHAKTQRRKGKTGNSREKAQKAQKRGL